MINFPSQLNHGEDQIINAFCATNLDWSWQGDCHGGTRTRHCTIWPVEFALPANAGRVCFGCRPEVFFGAAMGSCRRNQQRHVVRDRLAGLEACLRPPKRSERAFLRP